MSLFSKAIRLLFVFQLLFDMDNACNQDLISKPEDCADQYRNLIVPHLSSATYADTNTFNDFGVYLQNLPEYSPGDNLYPWMTYWDSQKPTLEKTSYCDAILPIEDELIDTCLCELKVICDNLCEERIQIACYHQNFYILFHSDASPQFSIDTNVVTLNQCSSVILSPELIAVCIDTEIYKALDQCANGQTTSSTSNPTVTPITILTVDTPSPTTTTTTSITTTTTTAITTQSPRTTSDNNVDIVTTNKDTTTQSEERITTQNAIQSTEEDITANNESNPSTTNENERESAIEMIPAGSHQFANLLLVSLIILGFSVCVA